MLRFLHIADVHLDTTFLCRSDRIRALLRDALRSAFARAVDCALQESVAAVLVAGDLFDGDRLSFTTERFLVDQIARLDEAGIPFLYATGNHDPGARSRVSRIAWPENVHLAARREPVLIDVEQDGVAARFVAAGHSMPHEEAHLAAAMPPAGPDVPHIGLLHTMVTSAGDAAEHDRYAPSTLDDLDRPGYAYWALGHIHLRQQLPSRTPAFYCGNIQGRTPRDTGARGGLLVSLGSDGAVTTEFRPFAPVQWVDMDLTDLAEARNLDRLERDAARAFSDVASSAQGVDDWLVRVTLSGPCPLADELRTDDQLAELESALAATLGAADVEVRTRNLTRPIDIDEHRGQPHLLGEVLALIEELREDPSRLAALTPDPLAAELPDDPEARLAYLVDLLDGLDREAADRLLIREH